MWMTSHHMQKTTQHFSSRNVQDKLHWTQGQIPVDFEEILIRAIYLNHKISTNILVFLKKSDKQNKCLLFPKLDLELRFFHPKKYTNILCFRLRMPLNIIFGLRMRPCLIIYNIYKIQNIKYKIYKISFFGVRMRPCLILPCTLLILGVHPSRGAAMQVNCNFF